MYELWDRDAGNIIGSFRTEGAALEAVRNVVEANPGQALLEALFLGVEDARGRTMVIAEGRNLLDRAGVQSLRGSASLVEAPKRRAGVTSWFLTPGHLPRKTAKTAKRAMSSKSSGKLASKRAAGSALSQRASKKAARRSKPKK